MTVAVWEDTPRGAPPVTKSMKALEDVNPSVIDSKISSIKVDLERWRESLERVSLIVSQMEKELNYYSEIRRAIAVKAAAADA